MVCGSGREHGKASVDTDGQHKWAEVGSPGRERERAEEKPKALSTSCDVRRRTNS